MSSITADPLYHKLGRIVEETRRLLGEAGGTPVRISVKSNIRMVGVQSNEAVVGGKVGPSEVSFTLRSDEREFRQTPSEVIGPYPLEYFLSSLGFCELTQYGRYAAYLGLKLDNVNITISGVFDKRGLYGIGDIDSTFSEISVTTNIVGGLTAEEAAELVKWVRRCCVVYNTLKKAVKIVETISLNGKTLDIYVSGPGQDSIAHNP
ncbi:MAG: OsmC family protein [Nitrososphaerota archaeon]